ncbi:MAG TPA: hypothetical protein VFQ53_23975 [Kofleriaceae bacterium]|nr:hypothetical protein [Kofleriaceae bacterium]
MAVIVAVAVAVAVVVIVIATSRTTCGEEDGRVFAANASRVDIDCATQRRYVCELTR